MVNGTFNDSAVIQYVEDEKRFTDVEKKNELGYDIKWKWFGNKNW